MRAQDWGYQHNVFSALMNNVMFRFSAWDLIKSCELMCLYHLTGKYPQSLLLWYLK